MTASGRAIVEHKNQFWPFFAKFVVSTKNGKKSLNF